MEKQKSGIAGKIIAGIFLAIVLAFMGLLVYIKLIPTFILGIIGVILLFLVLTVGILTWNSRKKVSFVIGIILALVFTAIFAFGGLYIYKTTSTLAQIAGANTEITQVGIYVRPDDSAVSVLDTAEYTYGIMTDLDRENTDKALEEVKQEVGTEVAVQEYRGLSELLNGLVSGEAGAIILNQAYLPIMEEMQGVPDMSSIMREINVKNVETVIDTKEDAVQPGEGEEGENAGSAAAKNGEVYTVFISGIDNRGGIVAKSRSDVNIIAVANTATRQLLLVSTPRDYFVPLSISGGVPDKLTHAGIYGISVCMNTLGMLYDTDINYYFRLNFAGFENIIDALGGINVYSDYDFDSQNILGYHYNQGENFVNGEQALVFARERYAFKEGDRQRGKNQMEVIKGVVNKALSPEILKNYSSVLTSLQESFETNISYEEIARLLQQQLKDGGAWNIVSYSVDGTGATEKPYSMSQAAYVMVPNYETVEKAKELMQKVCDGEMISQEDATLAEAAHDETAPEGVSEFESEEP